MQLFGTGWLPRDRVRARDNVGRAAGCTAATPLFPARRCCRRNRVFDLPPPDGHCYRGGRPPLPYRAIQTDCGPTLRSNGQQRANRGLVILLSVRRVVLSIVDDLASRTFRHFPVLPPNSV